MIKQKLLGYLQNHIPAKDIIEKLCKSGNIYLVGGACREYKDHSDFEYLRDVDIVIDITDKKAFEKITHEYPLRKNRFGGYKFFCEGLTVDVWSIDDTWAFKEKMITCPRDEYIDRFKDTVFFNIDAIVYDWNNDSWIADKYTDVVSLKTLDIVMPPH